MCAYFGIKLGLKNSFYLNGSQIELKCGKFKEFSGKLLGV